MSDTTILAVRIENFDPTGRHDIVAERQRHLNEDIAAAAGIPATVKVGHPALGNERTVPNRVLPYVTSIDAAMTLLPNDADVMFARIGGECFAGLGAERGDGDTKAATLPLALCAAALRARAAGDRP